jgi:O-acetyl-ADP-ribose deacetylase (regulator of RNase III)
VTTLEKIYLADVSPVIVRAFRCYCGDVSIVEVFEGSILDLTVDAVVSPANSFGFMDGGIDMAYSSFFGWTVQERLQEKIRKYHNGELLVGCAEIVSTGHERIPWIISAPTMRVPMRLANTVNPYLATRAALLLQREGAVRENKRMNLKISHFVKSIAFPGLGTGVGGVSPEVCARQIRAAIDQFIFGDCPYPKSWKAAQDNHQLLYADSVRDLQFEE